jgi:iron complex outermembrane recepter protein
MPSPLTRLTLIAMAGVVLAPGTALAQRAGEDVISDSDDAFGTTVGQESTGIYTERNTRGFNPLDAGNVRIDGIYFDPVAILAGRLRRDTAIRVGFAAIDFPFVAPTGVVDHHFRSFPDSNGHSFNETINVPGGHIDEWDMRWRSENGKFAVTGGVANANLEQVDRSKSVSWGFTLRPIIRAGGMEFAPFASAGRFTKSFAKPLAVVRDGYLPDQPPGRYIGQRWAAGERLHQNWGATLKARITDRLSFRGGYFYSVGDQISNFSEIYQITGPANQANHFVFADPKHDIGSHSGEGLLAFTFGKGRVKHRFFAGFRNRNRLTETGGSDPIDVGAMTPGQTYYGETDRIDEPARFNFRPINVGRVRQSSWMAGYSGQLQGLGHLNIGIQKARYRATSFIGATGVTNRSRANPWLYNATLMIEITPGFSAYVATQRGLEDSGLAPENAANRNAQLPATKATQYEGGVRWDFGKGNLVVSAFQITKPYFTFDGANNFVQRGSRRHRGLEVSLTGHFGERLNIVAGGVLIDAEVTGEARTGPDPVGKRPAGTPNVFAQLNANYRTGLLNDLALTLGLKYTGKRAVTSKPIGHLGGKQLTLPGWLRVDLGLRERFSIGKVDASVRAIVQNVTNEKNWYVVAPDVVWPEERRKLLLILTVDL